MEGKDEDFVSLAQPRRSITGREGQQTLISENMEPMKTPETQSMDIEIDKFRRPPKKQRLLES